MKTIGVLGLGAQATVDLEARIHAVAARVVPQSTLRGYPPMIVIHYRRPPVLLGANSTPVVPFQVDPAFLDAARWLGPNCDFMVLTANAPHLFRAQLEEAAGRPLLSMIDATIDEVRRRGWRRVGVLAFGDPLAVVYTKPLGALGIAFETIDPAYQPKINAAVISVMEGRETDEGRAFVRHAVDALRARGVDGVIPGCTELPLLLGRACDVMDMVNPAQLLAEAAVRRAMEP